MISDIQSGQMKTKNYICSRTQVGWREIKKLICSSTQA
jgi:hypothetical protein